MRDGLPTKIILLYNPEDKDLPEHFIKNSKPSIKKYERFISEVKKEPLAEWGIMRKTNLNQIQTRVIKADLLEQGIIREVLYSGRKMYEYQYNSPALNTEPFEKLRNFQFKELKEIINYSEGRNAE